jgi:Icc protein
MSEPKNPAQPVTLLHVTDTHLHAAADSRMRGVNTLDTLAQVLATVQADPVWPPAGVLATGDLVQDESSLGYERFKTSMADLGTPVYCIPGNHDDPVLMAKALCEAPFQVGGEIRLGNWTLVMLSTHRPGDDAGYLDDAALQNLNASLAANANQHVLIVMHHHPIPMHSAWLDGVGLREPEKFLGLVERHDNVRGILWGHVHQASDRTHNGMRMLSTPSTCSQFLPEAEFFALDQQPPGFRWLNLMPDGTIDTRVGWAAP